MRRGGYHEKCQERLEETTDVTLVCISQKSLRDHLKILERDCKARKREAEHGSGLSPEYREIDEIMKDWREETRKRLSRLKNQLRIKTRTIKIRHQGRR